MSAEVVIRYATPDDVDPLFAFLLLMAGPVVHAPIREGDARTELERVVWHEYPILATIAGEVVGALGLIKVQWWFNNRASFLTDRWFFLYPQLRSVGIGAKLLAEAGALSAATGAPVIINGHLRRRNRTAGAGIIFNRPLVIHPDDVATTDWNEAANRVLGPEAAAAA